MKKIIALLVILVLVSSFSLAVAEDQRGIHEPTTGLDTPELREEARGTGQGLEQNATAGERAMAQEGETLQVQEQKQIRDGTANQTQERKKLQTGLENALTRVTNENARARLQRNLERFQEKYEQRLQRMDNVTVEEDQETGEVTIEAKEPVRWLGIFKGKATKRFDVDANGTVNERAPWYRFLYAEDVLIGESEE